MKNNVIEKVWKNSLETCEYLGGYENSTSTIRVRCIKHNYEFETKYENVRRDARAHFLCPYCQQEARDIKFAEKRTLVKCAYCGKEFYKPNSKLENSKSGLYFCCREHKDLAQQIEFGLEEMWPEHYNQLTSYRNNAFRHYPNKCAICSWDEDKDILEVHHIDEDRSHNDLENLIILCPICHRKLTSHKYKLINREQIVLC